MNFTLFEISRNGYIKFKFFAAKKLTLPPKIYVRAFFGIETPNILSKAEKTAFRQREAFARTPGQPLPNY